MKLKIFPTLGAQPSFFLGKSISVPSSFQYEISKRDLLSVLYSHAVKGLSLLGRFPFEVFIVQNCELSKEGYFISHWFVDRIDGQGKMMLSVISSKDRQYVLVCNSQDFPYIRHDNFRRLKFGTKNIS